MSLSELKKAGNRSVGSKQTKKAIENGTALKVYIAKDAESHVTTPLIDMCTERGIEIVYIDEMRTLGEACGIQVGAASAAIVSV
ncbi:MAG: 50S ribosomal protein L7Ae-like protein [Firmicutes bacterium]|nr:50S ribosomal protein L7Ae-like protein [Bacillota bacterium]